MKRKIHPSNKMFSFIKITKIIRNLTKGLPNFLLTFCTSDEITEILNILCGVEDLHCSYSNERTIPKGFYHVKIFLIE